MDKRPKALLYNIIHKDDMPDSTHVPLAYVLIEEYMKKHAPDCDVLRHDYIVDDSVSNPAGYADAFDIVGFQMTYANADIIMGIIDGWQAADHIPLFVLGGVMPSAVATELIRQYPRVDAVVVAEGEETFLELTYAAAHDRKMDHIPGVVYRDEAGNVKFNKGRRPLDLDTSPIPERSFMHEVDQEEIKKTSIRVQTARGCLGRCRFCLNSYTNRLDKITTKAWRGMTPERVVDEIAYLHETFGVQMINFVDPSFEDPGKKGKKRIESISRMLIDRNIAISFKANIRAETFDDRDLDLLDLLKQAGLDIIVLGIEAASDEELVFFGKNADTKKLTEAFLRLKKMDCFNIHPGFIPIHPYTTLATLKHAYEYLNHIGLSHAFNIFRNALIPLRGTDIYDQLNNDGLISNHKDILMVPTFKFKDRAVAEISHAIQQLKVGYPVLNEVHKRLMDAGNILSRSKNRMFGDMISREPMQGYYHDFSKKIERIREELENRYYSLQTNIIDMAEKRFEFLAFLSMAEKTITDDAPRILDELDLHIKAYTENVSHSGYNTQIFESRAWGSFCQERKFIGTSPRRAMA